MKDRQDISLTFKPDYPGLKKFFGKLEAEVLEIIWENHPVTINRVLYFMNKKRTYAYTTIMTVMNRLVTKNILSRTKKSHSYVYSPQIGKKEFLEMAAEKIIEGLFGDYKDIASAAVNRVRKAGRKS